MIKKTFGILFLIAFTVLGFSENVAVFTDFSYPYEFRVDEDRFYISEGVNIYIYSLKDYKLIKKVGKKGEGPGEFLITGAGNGLLISVLQDSIVVNSYGKLVYLTKSGDYLKEKKIAAVGRLVFPFNDQFVGLEYQREKNLLYHHVNIYNSSFDLVKTIYKHEHGLQLAAKKSFNPLTITPPETLVSGNMIFMMDGQREAVHVFNQKGETLFSVTNKDELVKYTDEDRSETLREPLWKSLSQRYQLKFDFPGYFPPIKWYYIDPVQKVIYLVTYQKGEGKTGYNLFDFKGRFIKKIILPSGNDNELQKAFYNGKYYQLVENEDEGVWELHIMKVEK